MAKEDKKVRLPATTVCEECDAQLSIIKGQARCSYTEVFEGAIALLYGLFPQARDERVDIDTVVQEALARAQQDAANQDVE